MVDFGRWLLEGSVPFFRYLNGTPNLLSLASVRACPYAAIVVASGLGGLLLLLASSHGISRRRVTPSESLNRTLTTRCAGRRRRAFRVELFTYPVRACRVPIL